MEHCGSHLDDEMLRTFMCEAAAIINSRPLTVVNIHDPNALEPLTPYHLLTMESKIILSPRTIPESRLVFALKMEKSTVPY